MEEIILISYLNDFIFCPISIYFHKLYGTLEKTTYNSTFQVNGINSHKAVDNQTYSDKTSVLQGMSVYSENLGIMGKIDVFDVEKGLLTERKNKVIQIYDGYIYQVYAQYYALIEMGYRVNKIRIHSIKDNKNYDIKLPTEDIEMDVRFKQLIKDMRTFDMNSFKQTNIKKCENCIYEPSCDRSLLC